VTELERLMDGLCAVAAERIAVLDAELVGLREQLARQAPLCDAAVRHADAVDAYQRQGIQIIEAVDRERDQSAARLQYEAYEFAAAVRALSVPAPPEAPACSTCNDSQVVSWRITDDEWDSADCPDCAAAPPTEEEAP
jgi:hypothetical protein